MNWVTFRKLFQKPGETPASPEEPSRLHKYLEHEEEKSVPELFQEYLRDNPDVAESIRANIAMTQMDAIKHYTLAPDRTEHQIAVVCNDGADRFMKLFLSQQ